MPNFNSDVVVEEHDLVLVDAGAVATERPRRLGRKVRELVNPDRLDRPEVGRLTRAEVQTLTAAVTDPRAFAEPVSVRHALHALAVGAKGEVAVPVLADVLAGRRTSETERVVVARELGGVATPAAEASLTRHVRERNPRVQQAVLAGLGTFAGPRTLRDLADDATRRQLALTRALIAHRHGLDGPFLREARESGAT